MYELFSPSLPHGDCSRALLHRQSGSLFSFQAYIYSQFVSYKAARPKVTRPIFAGSNAAKPGIDLSLLRSSRFPIFFIILPHAGFQESQAQF